MTSPTKIPLPALYEDGARGTVVFQAVANFRWAVDLRPGYDDSPVLQQQWFGPQGASEWRPVPTVVIR